jgi:hypothetical protein
MQQAQHEPDGFEQPVGDGQEPDRPNDQAEDIPDRHQRIPRLRNNSSD